LKRSSVLRFPKPAEFRSSASAVVTLSAVAAKTRSSESRSSVFDIPRNPPPGLKFLDEQTLAAMFTLSKDIEPVPVEINRLDNQVLVRYYEGEWRKFE
jgi:hypothetical protein